jgi:hypothetical protein
MSHAAVPIFTTNFQCATQLSDRMASAQCKITLWASGCKANRIWPALARLVDDNAANTVVNYIPQQLARQTHPPLATRWRTMDRTTVITVAHQRHHTVQCTITRATACVVDPPHMQRRANDISHHDTVSAVSDCARIAHLVEDDTANARVAISPLKTALEIAPELIIHRIQLVRSVQPHLHHPARIGRRHCERVVPVHAASMQTTRVQMRWQVSGPGALLAKQMP